MRINQLQSCTPLSALAVTCSPVAVAPIRWMHSFGADENKRNNATSFIFPKSKAGSKQADYNKSIAFQGKRLFYSMALVGGLKIVLSELWPGYTVGGLVLASCMEDSRAARIAHQH